MAVIFISIGKVATIMGVSTTALRRWDKEKKLPAAFRTIGKHRRYRLQVILEKVNQVNQRLKKSPTNHQIKTKQPRAITYARVSTVKQKEDLKRQQEHLQKFTESNKWKLVKSYQDIASGLNNKRKGLQRLLKELPIIQPDYLVCSYNDRLARFGTEVIKTLCELYDTKVIITNKNDTSLSLDEQLATDVIAVITSFAGKLYRRRRGKYAKKIDTIIQ